MTVTCSLPLCEEEATREVVRILADGEPVSPWCLPLCEGHFVKFDSAKLVQEV